MSAIAELESRYRQQLIERLVAVGVPADRVKITYQELLQDYEVLISETQFSDRQLEDMAAATWALGCVMFTDIPTYGRYSQIVSRVMAAIHAGKILTDEQGRVRPVFDAGKQGIAEYAAALEDWCGRQRETLFSVLINGEMLVGQVVGLPVGEYQREMSSCIVLREILGQGLRYAFPNG